MQNNTDTTKTNTPLDRMLVEQGELETKKMKADAFVTSDKFKQLPYVAQMLLAAQHLTMEQYSYILSDRIEDMSGRKPKLAYFDFGTAVNFLIAGGAVRRSGWREKGDFVVKQVPSTVNDEIIPNMQSLPTIAKNIVLKRENNFVSYTNQLLVIHPDGTAESWLPDATDIFATDWCLVTD